MSSKGEATNELVFSEDNVIIHAENALSCVTKKYIYQNLAKVWFMSRTRVDATDYNYGFSFAAPADSVLWVAQVREGKESVEEEMWENAVSEKEFESMLKRNAALIVTTEKSIFTNEKGF